MFIDIDAEQNILGTIIVNEEYLRRVEDVLIDDYFAEPFHQRIYQKFFDLKKEGISINQTNLRSFFVAEDKKEYLSTLMANTGSFIDIRDCAFVLKENYSKRKLIDLFSEAAIKLEKAKVAEALDEG